MPSRAIREWGCDPAFGSRVDGPQGRDVGAPVVLLLIPADNHQKEGARRGGGDVGVAVVHCRLWWFAVADRRDVWLGFLMAVRLGPVEVMVCIRLAEGDRVSRFLGRGLARDRPAFG
ncbi:hypothetical protein GCM10027300_41530 [Modestobacter lapidis]